MKRLLYLFSCLLMVLSIGCGGTYYWTYTTVEPVAHVTHPTEIPVWIDSSFNAYQMESIQAAIAEWNYVLNGQIKIKLQMKSMMGIDKQMHQYPNTFATWEDGQAILKQVEKTDLGWVVFNVPSNSPHADKDLDDGVLAYVTGIDNHFVIVVSDRFGSRSFKDILMHEFAHLLGAEHVLAPSLEYPIYGNDQYTCIDKITVAQVAHTRKLDFDNLNYCITPHFE